MSVVYVALIARTLNRYSRSKHWARDCCLPSRIWIQKQISKQTTVLKQSIWSHFSSTKHVQYIRKSIFGFCYTKFVTFNNNLEQV